VTQYALAEELGDYMGRKIPAGEARADLILELVSGKIDSYVGFSLAYRANDDVRIPGAWKRALALPARPVWGVTSVAMQALGESAETVQAVDTYRLEDFDKLRAVLGFWGGPETWIHLVYTHGYALSEDQLPIPNPLGVELLPDQIKGVCLSAASRTYSNPDALAQESIGQAYSVTYGSPAGGIKLNEDEEAVLNPWARKV